MRTAVVLALVLAAVAAGSPVAMLHALESRGECRPLAVTLTNLA